MLACKLSDGGQRIWHGPREKASLELSHPGCGRDPEGQERGTSRCLGRMRRAAYLRSHAAALAVVLGDELVEEQVNLHTGHSAVIRLQRAESGRQAAEPIVLLRRQLPRGLSRLSTGKRGGDLHRRHFSYVRLLGKYFRGTAWGRAALCALVPESLYLQPKRLQAVL